MSAELRYLQSLIQLLKNQEADLVGDAARVNQLTRGKEEEVRSLTAQVTKLRMGTVVTNVVKVWTLVQQEEDQKSSRQEAIDILPEEMWEKIIGMISNPDDLWNLCNTCVLFEDLLSSFKTGLLMTSALPYLYPYLPRNKLLECRMVSKSWNGAIDTFLENHHSLLPYHDENGSKDYRKLEHVCPLKEKNLYRCNSFYFCNDRRDNSSLINDASFPGSAGKCPFPSSYVGIKMGRETRFAPPDRSNDGWWDRLDNFLYRFGRGIKNFTLVLPTAFDNQIYGKIENLFSNTLLQSMPNLLSLTLDLDNNDFDGTNLWFPVHDKLESLRVMNFHPAFNTTIATLAANFGPQLKKLCLDPGCEQVLGFDLFQNVIELSLGLGTGALTDPRQLDMLTIGRIPNLTKLNLQFPMRPLIWYFEDLLQILNRLTTITLLKALRVGGNIQNLNFKDRYEGQADDEVQPSEITTLELEMDWIECELKRHRNFNFLLPCFPNLENLIIFARKNDSQLLPDMGADVDIKSKEYCQRWIQSYANYEDEFVEVHRYMFRGKEMYNSNIWKLMPRLNVLTIQFEVFTRSEYEDYEKRRVQLTG